MTVEVANVPVKAQPDSVLSAQFVTISSIDDKVSDTWDGKVALTFDIDWACDEVVADTIELAERANVAATWFITHDTPMLERLRANPLFELGIHPNFLPLFAGDPSKGANAEEVVDRLLRIVPEAQSVRSHSLVQSGRLLQLFARKGLTHDCNVFIPESSGIELKPWRAWFGIIEVPYGWEDDFAADAGTWNPADTTLGRSGIQGFDFHPIHVFLNTESLSRYEATRALHRSPEDLIPQRCSSRGTRTALLEVLAQGRPAARGGVLPA